MSRRFGAPKLLHKMQDGSPMLLQTVGKYCEVFGKVHIVVREDDRIIQNAVTDYSTNVLTGSQWQSEIELVTTSHNSNGISQSIVAGINTSRTARAWLIALGDMPYVMSNTIRALAMALDYDNIVVPSYRGQIGNPVGFGKSFINKLLALQGDSGGKSIIKRAHSQRVILDTADEGVLLDIDRSTDIL